MAIVVETLVPLASRTDAETFDAAVEAAMMRQGGPPAGLMVILPALSATGLESEEPSVSPVWTFARP